MTNPVIAGSTRNLIRAHASIHGNTAKVAQRLGEMLKEKGAGRVVVADLCREDMAEIIEDAFRMNSQTDREGYPEIAEAFNRYFKKQ